MDRITIALLAGVASMGIMSSAVAADLIIEEAPVVGVVDVSGSWEGPYVGGFIGYGFSDADQTGPNPPAGPYPDDGVDIELSGFVVGVTAGADFYITDGVVAGIVGDLAWSDIGGEYESTVFPGSLYDGTTHDINWTGSLRGRLGFDGGAFLPYLTAGLAVANATRVSGFDGPGDPLEASATHIGWTVGAGVEFAVTEDVSVDLLYRYSDYGTETYEWEDNPGVDNPEVGLTVHTVSVGLNWRF